MIGSTVGQPNFGYIVLHLGKGKITIGNFINAVIEFLIVAAVVYFVFVLPMNFMMKKLHPVAPPAPPATKPCPECLSEIPLAAKRCAHCAQPVPAQPDLAHPKSPTPEPREQGPLAKAAASRTHRAHPRRKTQLRDKKEQGWFSLGEIPPER